MFLFSKYFLFIALGMMVTLIPVILKLMGKKKYGTLTFCVIVLIFLIGGSVYFLLENTFWTYFN